MRIAVLLSIIGVVVSLDNGLIRTPPMGWLSWERFRCQTDCVNYPDSCISEKLLMDMADRIASDGYKDVGYEYVNVDDCWPAKTRAANGRLQPDPTRFPSGMKALTDYIHGKGLKFGLYEDVGTRTCAGYPGSLYTFELDAQTFADWGVDYLKFDGCNLDPGTYSDGSGYPPMAFYLNKTGRPIALSCEYALYQRGSGHQPDYKAQAAACNVARNYNDIDDSWDSVFDVINFYGRNEGNYSLVAGPGFFNDPDMLVIGNFGLSYSQERAQMAIWCIIAAPLLMSVDLRNIRPESKALLQNKRAIAINQDPLGIQGQRIKRQGNVDIWVRPVTPSGSFAFVFMNFANDQPVQVSVLLSDLGMNNAGGYNVSEIFDGTYMGIFKPSSRLSVTVGPSGSVFFGKATVLAGSGRKTRLYGKNDKLVWDRI